MHIYYAQNKGIQHTSIVKPALKVEDYIFRAIHNIASFQCTQGDTPGIRSGIHAQTSAKYSILFVTTIIIIYVYPFGKGNNFLNEMKRFVLEKSIYFINRAM